MKTLGMLFYPSVLRTVVNIALNTVVTNILGRLFPLCERAILCSTYIHMCMYAYIHKKSHTHPPTHTRTHTPTHPTHTHTHTNSFSQRNEMTASQKFHYFSVL
jgi:hypothetical protein